MFNRKKLRQQIVQLFTENELKTLCFDLRIDYEILEGSQKEAKVVSLIAHVEKHGRISDLLDWLTDERPNTDWRQVLVNSEPGKVNSEPPVRSNDFSRQTATAADTVSTTRPVNDARDEPARPERRAERVVDSYVDEKTGAVMLRVPAGEFLYGDKKEKVSLPEFWIAKTPVTNAQYKKFIDATPKQPVPRHWDAKTRTYPAGKADHPVVYVSWHDAQAYAAWAGGQLPTEQEWEKAARGTDGRLYPWGNDEPTPNLCNFNGNVGDTTPVGRYSPQGDSPYGCVDMSGNVWEWTESLYADVEAWRVLRGGAWDNSRNLARAAYRGDVRPDLRRDGIGFRVVVRRPPSR